MIEVLWNNVAITAQSQVVLNDLSGSCVYMLHFNKPRYVRGNQFAGHYVGTSKNLMSRLCQHAVGAKANGNNLVQAAIENGGVVIVRIWPASFGLETYFKHRNRSNQFCPICRYEIGKSPVFRINKNNKAYKHFARMAEEKV